MHRTYHSVSLENKKRSKNRSEVFPRSRFRDEPFIPRDRSLGRPLAFFLNPPPSSFLSLSQTENKTKNKKNKKQDHNPNVWYTEDGRRLGNYVGHNGAVSTCDVSRDTELLLTGSADSSAKLWDVKTGECHATWGFDAPCKAVAFALGDGMAALSTDPFMSREPAIHLVSVNREDPSSSGNNDGEDGGGGGGGDGGSGGSGGGRGILRKLSGFKGRTNRVAFTDGNACLLSAGEDGVLRRWDVETGQVRDEAEVAEGPLTDLQLSADGTHLVVSSLDTRARLIDAVSLEVLKTYQTGTNANAAAIHPTFPHVLVGGGQEASQVTTTSSRAGKFEARFFHTVYAEEVGHVRGHFGPINAVAFAPDGRSFATGGEDGYVRLHHFDSDYFKLGSRES